MSGLGRRELKTVEAREACEALELYLGAAGGFLELEAEWPEERGSAWLDVQRFELARMVALHEELGATQMMSLARPKRRWGSPRYFPVLWVKIEQKPAAQRLRACAAPGSRIPVPTIVLREGSSSRYTAFWALKKPITSGRWEDLLRANERLCYALSGRRKSANPDHFWFHPPGSVIRKAGKQPCPVVATRVGTEQYSVRELVDGLRDAPDLDALRDRGYQPAPA